MPALLKTCTLVAAVGAVPIVLGLGSMGFLVDRATRPPAPRPEVTSELLAGKLTETSFEAQDGVRLKGSWLRGRAGVPTIVLCHDFGSSRAALLHLGLLLQNEGFSVLLFDFRGHGESSRSRSTLGLHEKRDVLAALDHLRRLGPPVETVGVYGIGMGAHAAVLAARDRPRLRVLVLDGLYPDVSFRLVRRVYAGWDVGIRRFGFLPESVFALISGTPAGAERAGVVLGQLTGRDVLLLASEADPALHEAIRHMYDSIPPQPDVDGNLLVLPATQSDGLYGDDLALHHDRVVSFFCERLRRS